MIRRTLSVALALVACAALPQVASASVALDDFRLLATRTVPLIVSESLPGFAIPAATLEGSKGMYRFSVLVPSTARGIHGIGIDGGPYENTKGAPVKPGRITSLTVYLPSGDYTVFDSHGPNRAKGYAVKLHVTSKPAPRARFGKPCVDAYVPAVVDRIWTVGETCHLAEGVAKKATEKWQAGDFAYAPIPVHGYVCAISPFSAVGLEFTCLKGKKRVTLAG